MVRTTLRLVLASWLLFLPVAALCLSGEDPEGKIPITTSSEQARSHFLAGRLLVDNLRLTDAIADFEKAVQEDTLFALAFLYRAQTARTPAEFFSYLEKAVHLAPRVSEGERLWILAVQAGASADQQTQKRYFQKLVEAYPGDERAHTLLGILHFGLQEYPDAVKSFENAIHIDPTFPPAYNQLGYAYRFLERFADAEKTFKKYAQLIPGDPNPYDSYAEFLLKVGRFDDAIVQYRKALKINEHFTNAYTGVAAALMYQGKHADARRELEKAYGLARTDAEQRTALFASAVTYADEGKMEQALQEMDRQYTMGWQKGDAPAMAGDLVAVGNILLEMGRSDDALDRFEQAQSAIKGSGLSADIKENAALVFHYNAARVAIMRNDLDAAAKGAAVFQAGVEKKKNRNQMRLAQELAGMIALEKKQYQKAIDALQQSNLQNPYNLYRLALAYQGSGDREKAKEYAHRAAKFNALPALNYAFVRARAEALDAGLKKGTVG